MKQLQIIEDFRQGGTLAFREIKDAEWCPMSTVHFTNTVPIKKVRWSKQGTNLLPLAQTANLDSRFDIDFQGQKRKVVATHGCVAQLDEPVSLRSNDFEISQCCVTARPSEMLEQLEKSWQVFFKRDARCTPDDWYEADQLLHVLHDCPTMDYIRIEPQDLEKAMQGTKVKSARGSDGFSTMDLRKIPTNLWQLLCGIFHAIENDGADWHNFKMDTEMWQLILQQISLRPKGCVSIKKVHAHQNWQNLPMGLERWCAFYNDWVDFHAKQSICIDQKEHFDWVVKMEKAEAKLRQTHEVFVNFVCDVARCFENTSSKSARTRCEGKTNFDIRDPLLTASTVGISKSPNIDSDMFFAFPWGPQLLWRLVQWSQQLAWCPHGQCQCTADISATELFADFAVTMGSGMPVCLTTRKERKLDVHNKPFSRWELQDLNVQADMLGTLPLSVHTTTFVRVLKFLEKHGRNSSTTDPSLLLSLGCRLNSLAINVDRNWPLVTKLF